MFIEEEFECVTVPEVLQEIKRTQKFKEKYPWRKDYLTAIKVKNLKNDNFDDFFRLISYELEAGKVNRKTKRYFNLSKIDRKIAVYAIANQYHFSSVDDDLADYLEQEHDIKNFYPLEIINSWLRKQLIQWDEIKQNILSDWERCNEHPQPKKEVERFKKLTGFNYPGPVQK